MEEENMNEGGSRKNEVEDPPIVKYNTIGGDKIPLNRDRGHSQYFGLPALVF
jgi:hypothetical protein